MTRSLSQPIGVGSYEQLAVEYYDADRHPTCANFRQASRALFAQLMPEFPANRSCEVGAGDSLLAELLHRRGHDLRGLIVTDDSASMLEYSRKWEPRGAQLVVAAAESLPLPDCSLLLVAASLADPYDDNAFWSEVSRVLAPGGMCVVTTPSITWAERFRVDGQRPDAARFELEDGTLLDVPSYIRAPAQEWELIQRHHLERVDEAAVTLDAISKPISHKLLGLKVTDPVVVGYVARRRTIGPR